MNDGDYKTAFDHLGSLYGLRGLEVRVEKNTGTFCEMTGDGIVIVIDREVISIDEAIPDEAAALYVVARELGRAFEMTKNPGFIRAYLKKSQSEKLFYDFIDYTAIDFASHRIPLLEKYIDDIYAVLMPHNLKDIPAHLALLYAIRISQVEKNSSKLDMADKVSAILRDLRDYHAGNLRFDVISACADPQTSPAERRQIADIVIKPRYQELYRALRLTRTDTESEDTDGGDDDEIEGNDDGGQAAEQTGENAEYQDEAVKSLSDDQKGDECETGFEADTLSALGDTLRSTLVEALGREDRQTGPEDGTGEPAKTEQAAQESGGTDNAGFLPPLTCLLSERLGLDTAEAGQYVLSLDKWRSIIRHIAELFLKLAYPAETLLSPRYDLAARSEGCRLHPRRISEAVIQQKTGRRLAIWQSLKKSGRRQALSFGGLDVYLLADVSGSMEGEKAHCAADTALCLIEGLRLASYRSSGQNGLRRPDVRLELTAFGAGFDLICPLSYEPGGEQKGRVFHALRNAHSKGTYIGGALDSISRSVRGETRRSRLVFIVSDGKFHDAEEALKAARALGTHARIKQVFIGEAGTVIADSWETISSPRELPEKLRDLLREQLYAEQA